MFHCCEEPARRQVRYSGALPAGLALLALSACSDNQMGFVPGPPGSMQAAGRVQGGQQPVAGSQVTIYLAGTSGQTAAGYGSGDTVLAGPLMTNATGAFSYAAVSCPSGDPPVYLVAVGGDAGSGSNSTLALSAGLAHCSDLANSFVNIDEVTTVASVWALSQFLDSSGVHVGAPASNTVGLANAATMIANLADVTSGMAATTLVSGATGVPPGATVNTLANILSHCVNSDGSNTSTSPCGVLLSLATAPGGTAPQSTLDAALNIARNPGNNAAALFQQLTSSTDPFQTPPPLSSAPSDWTLAIQVTAAAVNPVTGLSIDKSGNAWIITTATGTLSELAPNAAPAAGSPFSGGGLTLPIASSLVIDASDNIWVGTAGAANLEQFAVFNDAGQAVAGSPFTSPGLSTTLGIGPLAADSAGNMWVVNPTGAGAADTLTEFPSGSFSTPNTVTVAGGLNSPLSGIGFDIAGNLFSDYRFVADATAQTPGGAALSGSPYAITLTENGSVLGAQDGAVWLLNTQAPELIQLVPATGSSGGYTANVINLSAVLSVAPSLGAFDGAGHLWIVSNLDSSNLVSLLELDSAGNPASGSPFLRDQLSESLAMAIDGSGNIWIGGQSGENGSLPLQVVVGAATPVKTPVTGVPQLP